MATPDQISVLHVTSTLRRMGGAENLLLNVAERTDRSRFRLAFCCLGQKGALGERIESLGWPVAGLNFSAQATKHLEWVFSWRLILATLVPSTKGRWEWDPIVKALLSLIREHAVDVVHTHLNLPGFYGRIAAWVAERPRIVCSYHNTLRGRKLKHSLLGGLLARVTDRILVSSPQLGRSIMWRDLIPPSKLCVIPYGVDVERFVPPASRKELRERLGIPGAAFVLGTVGSLEWKKGHAYLLRALPGVVKQHPNVVLVLVGDGTERQHLERLAKAEGVAEHVRFLGFRSDLPEVLGALDLFVMPSLMEGMPLALLSAIAMGLPAVVTAVGSMPAVVSEECGSVVPPRDEQALRIAISRLAEDPVRIRVLGKCAREIAVNRFGIDTMVRAYQGLYAEVCGCDPGKKVGSEPELV